MNNLLLIFLCAHLFQHVYGHAKFLEPPSRASMWRKGFNNPKNYDDNQGFCGGRSYQKKLKGKCGICGDPWQAKIKPHEAPGGKYANGIIVRTYEAGQEIKVTIEMNANHKGYFEFKLCVNNDKTKDKPQSCFDENVLKVMNGKDNKYYVPIGNKKMYPIIKLPKGLVCDQCILQWTYITGNCWECPVWSREHFRNCADIEITKPQKTPSRTTTTTPQPDVKGCKFPEYKGDFSCDDGNNNPDCDYDGGDCCGNEVSKEFCKDCQCKDPAFKNSQITTTTKRPRTTTTKRPKTTTTIRPRTSKPSICEFPGYKNDGFCDDLSNTPECDYDGGDCCGSNVDKELCVDCKCLDPKYGSSDPFQIEPQLEQNSTNAGLEDCPHPGYVGDGICDDLSNLEECKWDGGDCCGETVDYNYCVTCECLDPNGLDLRSGDPKTNATIALEEFDKYYEQKRLFLESQGELD